MNWLHHLSIGTRLWAGFGIPLLMFSAYVGWMWTALERVQDHVETGLAAQVSLALTAKTMERDVIQVQQWLSDISATRALDGLDDGFKQAEVSRASFLKGLEQLRHQTRATPADQHSLNELQQAFDRYYDSGVAMARAYIAGGPERGNPLMDPFDQASQLLQKRMHTWVERASGDMTHGVEAIGQEAHGLQQLAAVTFATMLITLAVLAWWITRSIVQPLRYGVTAAQRVAEGILTDSLQVDGQDEAAQMLRALQTMQQQLRSTIGSIHQRAEEVNQSSQRITADNAELQRFMQEQAETELDTERAIRTMDGQVATSLAQAEQANALATQTTRLVQDTGSAVEGLVRTMGGIHDSSRRISDIISVIDGIAFQTNILALNAAVEAARAGESGRGFAVVASEVRALAGRSAAAAREINGLITDSVQRIEAGSREAEVAGQSMQTVVGSINQVAGLIAAIRSSAQNQQAGIQEVEGAVDRLGHSTRSTLKLVQEVSDAVGGLDDVSRRLQDAIGVFRLSSS